MGKQTRHGEPSVVGLPRWLQGRRGLRGADLRAEGRRLVLGEVAVLEAEIALLALAPRALPIEVDVYPLLVLLCDRLRLGVPLEPREVLDVKAPRLAFELLGGEVSAGRGNTR